MPIIQATVILQHSTHLHLLCPVRCGNPVRSATSGSRGSAHIDPPSNYFSWEATHSSWACPVLGFDRSLVPSSSYDSKVLLLHSIPTHESTWSNPFSGHGLPAGEKESDCWRYQPPRQQRGRWCLATREELAQEAHHAQLSNLLCYQFPGPSATWSHALSFLRWLLVVLFSLLIRNTAVNILWCQTFFLYFLYINIFLYLWFL